MARYLGPGKKNLYEIDIKDVDSTVVVMDRFEGNREPHIKYKVLLLKHAILLELDHQKYSVNLYICRDTPEDYPTTELKYIPKITFTDLKKESKKKIVLHGTNPDQVSVYDVLYPILKTIKHFSIQHKINVDTEFSIQSPLVFRAQNSDDRTGYGDEWRFGECLSVGTEYGQTTRYYVTKIKIVSA